MEKLKEQDSEEGEEKAREAVVRRNRPFVLSAQQQSEMLKVDFPPELMQARCE